MTNQNQTSLDILSGTHIQSMRGVEATTRQLLIAARQVCSTVQGIHLTQEKTPHISTRTLSAPQFKQLNTCLFYQSLLAQTTTGWTKEKWCPQSSKVCISSSTKQSLRFIHQIQDCVQKKIFLYLSTFE